MIDPKEHRPISFRDIEQPELPEISQADIEADREARRQLALENEKWLEEHNDWSPFGEVW